MMIEMRMVDGRLTRGEVATEQKSVEKTEMVGFPGRPPSATQTVVGHEPVEVFRPIRGNVRIALIWESDALTQAYRQTFYGKLVEDACWYMEQCLAGLRFNRTRQLTVNMRMRFMPLMAGIAGQGGPGSMALTPDASLNFVSLVQTLDAIEGDSQNNVLTTRWGSVAISSEAYPIRPNPASMGTLPRRFMELMIHELIHVFGHGALWNGDFRIVTSLPLVGNTTLPMWLGLGLIPGTNANTNRIGIGTPQTPLYTAPRALEQYRQEIIGQENAPGILIENVGMEPNTTIIQAGGTALAHWRGGALMNDLRDQRGRHYNDELMTHRGTGTGTGVRWLSRFTLASLEDVGWAVNYEPLDHSIEDYIRT
jgi:hypothetical protein